MAFFYLVLTLIPEHCGWQMSAEPWGTRMGSRQPPHKVHCSPHPSYPFNRVQVRALRSSSCWGSSPPALCWPLCCRSCSRRWSAPSTTLHAKVSVLGIPLPSACCQGLSRGLSRTCQGLVGGLSRTSKRVVKGLSRACQGPVKGLLRACQGLSKGGLGAEMGERGMCGFEMNSGCCCFRQPEEWVRFRGVWGRG